MSTADDATRRFMAQQARRIMEQQAALREAARQTVPRVLPPERPRDRTMADIFYEDTKTLIEETQSKLGADERLVGLYVDRSGSPIVVSDLGYHNPNLMVVWGTDPEGDDRAVVVHVSSFEIQLKVSKASKETPARPIGFVAQPREPDQ